MTLLVRDEEDILEWNLRYHLSRGIDHFVVTDNRSEDATADILREYERQGVVTYLHESDDDFSQDRWVTRMALLAQEKLRPDWVLHCDADEFWWPDDGTSLDDAFASVPRRKRAVRVYRHDFVGPVEHDDAPFFARMVYRVRTPTNLLGYPPPPKVAHRPLEEPYVHQGNHAVSRKGRVVRTKRLEKVSVLHFPARTHAQLREKIEKGGAAYERNERFDETVGATWRAMYRRRGTDEFDRLVEAHFLDADTEVVEDHRLHDYLAAL